MAQDVLLSRRVRGALPTGWAVSAGVRTPDGVGRLLPAAPTSALTLRLDRRQPII